MNNNKGPKDSVPKKKGGYHKYYFCDNVEDVPFEEPIFMLTENENFKSTIVINEDTPEYFKRFREYQEEALKTVKKEGLFVNRDLYQIM